MSRKQPTFLPSREKPAVTPVRHDKEQRAYLFMACALLLTYPENTWPQVLQDIEGHCAAGLESAGLRQGARGAGFGVDACGAAEADLVQAGLVKGNPAGVQGSTGQGDALKEGQKGTDLCDEKATGKATDLFTPQLPAESAGALKNFLAWANAVGQEEVEKTYVETFDQKRRCCLELTYFLTGDTRQRGIALSVFQDLYKALGWEIPSHHLPDFLPLLLEAAARSDDDVQELIDNVIGAHREGIEILHAALAHLNSPYAHVITALRMALPHVDAETQARIYELVRKGPPSELVGINDTVNLPWPTDHPLAGTPMPTEREKQS